MRRRGARILLRAARCAGLAALLALTPAPAPAEPPGCGVMVVPLRAGALVYRLERPFLDADSDSVWSRAGTLVRGRDYLLDPLRGELRVLRAEIGGDTLWVRACWLLDPPPLDLQLNAYRPADDAPQDTASTAAPEVVRRPSTGRSPGSTGGAALTLTGNKTIAVDFGNSQDAFLRQSLDLAVSGTLAPGVELTGVLTDRNTPLTTGGATQDLQSLDRVLVELRAPRATATLGDLTLERRTGEFGRLERRLQGVRGTWQAGGAALEAAAASAAGEYTRVQFFGVEGRQGPYTLPDRDGNEGVSVVAESEVVTLDGERLTRGESADYSIDYERAQLTFSNRRPITFASRITVEYQYAVNRFRRNLAAAGGRWERDGRYVFTQVVTEGDDRGRPLDATLTPADLTVLAFAGDSASQAIGAGVTAGGGDYDTVRVGGATVFAFAGVDSGEFAVRFTRLGPGRGDYRDSALVQGRTIFAWAGAGGGEYVVGRALPVPESHQLWSAGGGFVRGPLGVEVEGAVSRRDLNTASPFDDGDNAGLAGRAAMRLQGSMPGSVPGGAGLRVEARAVDERFSAFTRLEAPFAEESWGLPIGADLEHQRRVTAHGFYRPAGGGEFTAEAGRLTTPSGYAAHRGAVGWVRDGFLMTRARYERAAGIQDGLQHADGGRERASAALVLRLPWLEPGLRAESDERRFPSDSVRLGDRYREGAIELRSGRAVPWQITSGFALRRDARRTDEGFSDQTEARTTRFALDVPAGGAIGGALAWQRRDVRALADTPGGRSDLASARLTARDAARGLESQLNLELTSEGENRRVRELVFAGSGQGAYDSLGNFVGTGDYDLVIRIAPDLDRVSRTAASMRLGWTFGSGEVWRGSRVGFDFESEIRRRADFAVRDVWIAPGAVLGDPSLARGALLQRLETDLAPGAPAAAFRLRLERRVSADRSFENFAQTLDDRTGSLRWRVRPGVLTTGELEARTQRQVATQVVVAGPSLDRTLTTHTGSARLTMSPGAAWRAVGNVEASWSRAGGAGSFTRTLRIGPDLGVTVARDGRLEVGGRRAFFAGPPAAGLLPSADPAGFPTWEGNARFDYRVRRTTTVGVSYALRAFDGRRVQSNGRAEVRAFF